MDMTSALSAVGQGMVLAAKLSAPILIISMLVGLVIAIFQAATQIHEQTITFVPKFAVIIIVLLVSGNWMMNSLVEFLEKMLQLMIY